MAGIAKYTAIPPDDDDSLLLKSLSGWLLLDDGSYSQEYIDHVFNVTDCNGDNVLDLNELADSYLAYLIDRNRIF